MHTYLHKVQYYETDKMGITHHSNYIRWMEEARISFLDSIGYGYGKLENAGILSPVIGIDCRYQSPGIMALPKIIKASGGERGQYILRECNDNTVRFVLNYPEKWMWIFFARLSKLWWRVRMCFTALSSLRASVHTEAE